MRFSFFSVCADGRVISMVAENICDGKDMSTEDRNNIKKRLLLFLILVFFITCAFEFGVLFPKWREIRSIAALTVAPAMFIPAITAVIVRLITKEGFRPAYIDPRFRKGKRRYYLMAWFGPSVLTVIGVLIYFMIFRDNFSPDMEYYVGVLKEQGADYDPQVARNMVLSSAAAGFFLAPVLNFVTCFGEEWGWRGYLLPKLKELTGVIPAILISGVIWGLWHLPLTIMGHNYGLYYRGYPVCGILAMCCFCVVIGILFSWLFIRTGSVLPSVFAHGALNGFASLGIYFTKDGGNPFVGPSVTGIISGLPFIVCAVIVIKLLHDDPKEAVELSEEKPVQRRKAERFERRETQEGSQYDR